MKIYKMENDLANHVKEREEELDREEKLFNAKITQQIDRINLDVELRQEGWKSIRKRRKRVQSG